LGVFFLAVKSSSGYKTDARTLFGCQGNEFMKGGLTVSSLDHLLPFLDNGGRRSYTERRRNSKLARIPERRSGKERRIIDDRRRTLRYEAADSAGAQNEKPLNCNTQRMHKFSRR
jgi:hypothetical protein